MREILLSNGLIAQVDDEDYDKASKLKWYPIRGKNTFYATSYDKSVKPQKDLRLHWLIVGKPPKGHCVDHKDGNGLNNQKTNLRICTIRQNSANRRGWGSSKYLGVSYVKTRPSAPWQARIGRKTLGMYKTELEAAKAYDKTAKEIYGEYAFFNIQENERFEFT